MSKHARLSASSAKRWLTCPPSIALGEQFEREVASEYALEGTAAHTLAELKLKLFLKRITKAAYAKQYRKFTSDTNYYNFAFEEAVDTYVVEVMGTVNIYDNPAVMLEQKLTYAEYVPDGFGTGDVVIVSDGKVHIIDLKFGRGVPVDAEENPQLMLYALGAYLSFSMVYDIDEVIMTIIQPRLKASSTYSLPVKELLDWAENEVKPKALQAIAGDGEYNPTEDACRWCPAKLVCKARTQKNLEIARFEFSDTLSLKEVAEVLDVASEIKSWIADIEAHALESILKGEAIPGYKLVEGRSTRKITDPEKAMRAFQQAGMNPEDYLTKPALKTITALEKDLGKGTFNELIGAYVEKPAGKPTLALASDKRSEWSSVYADFADDLEEE